MTAVAAKVPSIAAALLLLTVLVPASAKPGPPPPAITVLQVGPGARYARIAAAVAGRQCRQGSAQDLCRRGRIGHLRE